MEFYEDYPIEEAEKLISWIYNFHDKSEYNEIKSELDKGDHLSLLRHYAGRKGYLTKEFNKTKDKDRKEQLSKNIEQINYLLNQEKREINILKNKLNMYQKRKNFKIIIDYGDFGAEEKSIKELLKLKNPSKTLAEKFLKRVESTITKAKNKGKTTKGLHKLKKAVKKKLQSWEEGGKMDISITKRPDLEIDATGISP